MADVDSVPGDGAESLANLTPPDFVQRNARFLNSLSLSTSKPLVTVPVGGPIGSAGINALGFSQQIAEHAFTPIVMASHDQLALLLENYSVAAAEIQQLAQWLDAYPEAFDEAEARVDTALSTAQSSNESQVQSDSAEGATSTGQPLPEATEPQPQPQVSAESAPPKKIDVGETIKKFNIGVLAADAVGGAFLGGQELGRQQMLGAYYGSGQSGPEMALSQPFPPPSVSITGRPLPHFKLYDTSTEQSGLGYQPPSSRGPIDFSEPGLVHRMVREAPAQFTQSFVIRMGPEQIVSLDPKPFDNYFQIATASEGMDAGRATDGGYPSDREHSAPHRPDNQASDELTAYRTTSIDQISSTQFSGSSGFQRSSISMSLAIEAYQETELEGPRRRRPGIIPVRPPNELIAYRERSISGARANYVQPTASAGIEAYKEGPGDPSILAYAEGRARSGSDASESSESDSDETHEFEPRDNTYLDRLYMTGLEAQSLGSRYWRPEGSVGVSEIPTKDLTYREGMELEVQRTLPLVPQEGPRAAAEAAKYKPFGYADHDLFWTAEKVASLPAGYWRPAGCVGLREDPTGPLTYKQYRDLYTVSRKPISPLRPKRPMGSLRVDQAAKDQAAQSGPYLLSAEQVAKLGEKFWRPPGSVGLAVLPTRPMTASEYANLFVQSRKTGPPAYETQPGMATTAQKQEPKEVPALPKITPLMGQMTMIAPPIDVASGDAHASGMAVRFDLNTLSKGSGPLTEDGLTSLRRSLPPNAQAIYPALEPGSAGPSAVNFSLAPPLLGQLLSQSYGEAAAAITSKAANAGSTSTPKLGRSQSLPGAIVPKGRPIGSKGSVMPDAPGHQGGTDQAGKLNSTRKGPLNFLGMPVKLAPSLGGSHKLDDEAEARKPQAASKSSLAPNRFDTLRKKMFPGFHGVTAEPDQHAWNKAAPSFGMKNGDPTTVLSSHARIKPTGSNDPLAQLQSPKPIGFNQGGKPIGTQGLAQFRRADLPHSVPPLGLNFPTQPIRRRGPIPTNFGTSGTGVHGWNPANRPTKTNAPSLGHTNVNYSSPVSLGSHRSPSHINSIGASSNFPIGSRGGQSAPSSPQIPSLSNRPFSPRVGAVGPQIGQTMSVGSDADSLPPSLAMTSSQPHLNPVAVNLPSAWREPNVEVRRSSPSLPLLANRPSARTRSIVQPPTLTYNNRPETEKPPLQTALQRATGGVSTPAQTQASTALGAPHASTARRDTASEINVMAQEVWSILKRRIAVETDRSGHR